MPEILFQQKYSVTAAGGIASFNTFPMRGELRQLIIKPATDTTKWKVTFTNDDSVIIYRSGLLTGKFVDNNPLTLFGIYTVAFEGVTVDEAIAITTNWKELQ